jgi:hypothetical protein
MPTLQMSQPVVAAVLGVVVLGETLNTGRAGMIALVAAALVMTAAIVKLARRGRQHPRQGRGAAARRGRLAGLIGPRRGPNDELIAVVTPIGSPASHGQGSVGKSH